VKEIRKSGGIRRTIKAATVALAVTVGAVVATSETATGGPSGRLVCFDRESWSANDGARPCARVVIMEDASMRVTTGTANGARAFWSCTLPAADGGKPRCVRAE
jgi:hypothetical protein